jgi:hypothetical protein
MVSDGIKAAQIQAKNSSLNSSWGSGASPAGAVVSAIRNVAVRLNSQSDGQRQSMGKHAGTAKSRSSVSHHVPKHAAA